MCQCAVTVVLTFTGRYRVGAASFQICSYMCTSSEEAMCTWYVHIV